MSLVFNAASTDFKGIAQIYEKEIGVDRGYITGNTNRLKEFTSDVNLAWDDYLTVALTASGTWQFDDSNQTDHPIIKTNIVASQNDYSFTTDESGNLILDIYKVAVLESATDTTFVEIEPIDQQSTRNNDLVTEASSSSAPFEYDKTGRCCEPFSSI